MQNLGLSIEVTIVGCGAVGMACVFSMLSRELVAEMVVADIDRKKLEGEVIDLSHAGGFFNTNVKCAGENYEGWRTSFFNSLS